ncbi:hypothetical protein ACJX0J_009158, partial [Zea mays]
EKKNTSLRYRSNQEGQAAIIVADSSITPINHRAIKKGRFVLHANFSLRIIIFDTCFLLLMHFFFSLTCFITWKRMWEENSGTMLMRDP